MKLECKKVSASDAGGQISQVLFEANSDQEDGPYVLLQRAWLEEDDCAASPPYYVETHDEHLIGHYATLEVELARHHVTLRLPPPIDEAIEIDCTGSDRDFRQIQSVLSTILQWDLEEDKKVSRQ